MPLRPQVGASLLSPKAPASISLLLPAKLISRDKNLHQDAVIIVLGDFNHVVLNKVLSTHKTNHKRHLLDH